MGASDSHHRVFFVRRSSDGSPSCVSCVQVSELGVNGFRVSLQYICSKAPSSNRYCFAQVFDVISNVDASTFCTKMAPIGCCTGTVFSYITSCATTNDTLSTNVGTISVSDLQDFCSDIDFLTPCSNAPELPSGACLEGYFLSGAWPSARVSIAMITLTLAAVIASLLL
jgi:hypothetical protein